MDPEQKREEHSSTTQHHLLSNKSEFKRSPGSRPRSSSCEVRNTIRCKAVVSVWISSSKTPNLKSLVYVLAYGLIGISHESAYKDSLPRLVSVKRLGPFLCATKMLLVEVIARSLAEIRGHLHILVILRLCDANVLFGPMVTAPQTSQDLRLCWIIMLSYYVHFHLHI
ncbi:hypothetical protein DFS33DRAFT_195015 [Desarmillaria ectypa]|nr:hypothetical protein DFS33DRAFT_195015 [Desarmillaria ectypa]